MSARKPIGMAAAAVGPFDIGRGGLLAFDPYIILRGTGEAGTKKHKGR